MKRSVDEFFGYGNVANEKGSLKKIKSLPEPTVVGQVLKSNDTLSNNLVAAEWTSSIDLANISSQNLSVSSSAQIESLTGVQSISGVNMNMTNINQANLLGCKVGATVSTAPGVVKFANNTLSYYDNDNIERFVSNRSDNVVTVGTGGNYSNLKAACDYVNTIPSTETVEIKILSDQSLSTSATVVISRSVRISSSGARKRIVVNIADTRNSNVFELSGSDNYNNIIEFDNIEFTFNNQNEYANNEYWDNSFFYHYYLGVTLRIRNSKIIADRLNCRFINIAGILEMYDNLIEASARPSASSLSFITDYTAYDNLKNLKSKFIYVGGSQAFEGVRKHIITNNRVTYQDNGLLNLLIYSYGITIPSQVFFFESTNTIVYPATVYDTEVISSNNTYSYYFDAADFNFTPALYNLIDMRKQNWQCSIFSLYGNVHLKSDSDDFRFRIYNCNSTLFNDTTYNFILPFAPVCIIGGDVAIRTAKVYLSNYNFGYKGVAYPTGIAGVTEASTIVDPNTSTGYGAYRFYHVIIYNINNNLPNDTITLSAYGLNGGNQIPALQQIILIDILLTPSTNPMLYLIKNNGFAKDLINNLRDITDNQSVQNLETNLTTTNNNLTTTNTNLTTLAGRVTVTETDIAALELDNVARDIRISDIEVVDGTQSSDISTLQSRCTTIEGVNTTQTTNISTNASAITALQTRCTAIEAVDGLQSTNISTNASGITTLQGRVYVNEYDIGVLQTDTASLASRATAIETLNTTQNGRLDTIEALNTTQNGRLDTIEALNTTQDGRLTSIETLNTAQNGRLDGIDTSISGIGTVNSTQTTNIAGHETRIVALEAVAPVVGITAGTNISVTGTTTKTIAVTDPPTFSSMTVGDAIFNVDTGADSSCTMQAGGNMNFYTNGVKAAAIGNDRIYCRTLVGMAGGGVGGNNHCLMYNCTLADHSEATVGSLKMISGVMHCHNGTQFVPSLPNLFAEVSCGMSGGTPTHTLTTGSVGVSMGTSADPATYFTLYTPTAPTGYFWSASFVIGTMTSGTQANIRFIVTNGTSSIQVQPSWEGIGRTWTQVTSGQIKLYMTLTLCLN